MRFMFLAAAVCVQTLVMASPVLEGTTSAPANSFFVKGREARLLLSAKGLEAHDRRPLSIGIFDHEDRKVGDIPGAEIVADASGVWKGEFALPTDRYGFYRVRISAGDLTVAKRGSRPAGFVTYAVLSDPKDHPIYGADRHFMGLHGDSGDPGLILPWLGARWTMNPGWWDGAEDRAKGIAAVKSCGWTLYGWQIPSHILLRWHLPPEDRAFYESHNMWDLYRTEKGREIYTRYLRRVIRNVKAGPIYPQPRIYEVFWEPDLTLPDAKTLVDAAKVAHDVVREEDPEGLIALPAMSGFHKYAVLREALELGLMEYGDIFDIHPYVAYPPEPNGLLSSVRAHRDLLRRYKPGVRMIGTESGAMAHATVAEERVQMEGQVREHLILMGEGFWFNCLFMGHDWGSDFNDRTDGDYGINYNLMLTKNYRHTTRAVSPRPAMAALSAFSRLLDGARPTAAIDSLGGTALGYAFQSPEGKVTLALWDYGKDGSTHKIPVGRKAVDVADVMGNVKRMDAPGGEISLALGTSPVYVLDVARDFWGEGGTMAVVLAKRAQERIAREQAARRLEIRAVAPHFSGLSPGVNVTVANLRAEPVRLKVETRIHGIPEARQSVQADLQANETRTVKVVFDGFAPDGFTLYHVETTASLVDGYRIASDRDLNFLSADYVIRAGSAAGAAAALAAWKPLKRQSIGRRITRNPGLLSGVGDLSAEMALGWNEDFLFVDLLVRDDSFVNDRDGWWSWRGDAVQLGFAKARQEAGSGNFWGDAADQGMTETTFALTKKGPEVYRTITFDPKRFPTGFYGEGRVSASDLPFHATKRKCAGGVEIHYRLAFPWRFMNKTSAAADEVIYMGGAVNDLDEGATDLSALDIFDLKKLAPRFFGAICLKAGAQADR